MFDPEEMKSISQNFVSNRAQRAGTIMERINTFEDVLYELDRSYYDVIPWRNPATKEKRIQNANAMIMAITEAYNEGVILDWSNREQDKYYLYFEATAHGWVLHGVYGLRDGACLGVGHYFKSRELAQDAYRKFKYVWDDYLPD